ncbi:hypothetical protein ACOMHN_040537 [Nucella lapillus]
MAQLLYVNYLVLGDGTGDLILKRKFMAEEAVSMSIVIEVEDGSNDIKCGQTDMSFSIPTSAINFVPKNVTLSDPRCHVNITVNRLTGKTPLNACGTTLRVTSDNLIFSNFLLLPPRRPSNNNNNNNKNITSNIEHIIPIECHYKRVSDLRLSYLPMVRQILFTETGVGQFQFRIEQFREGSYSSRIPDAEYPLEVTSSKRVYLQLSLGEWVQQGEGGYGMEVERCVASPSPSMMAFHNDSSKDLIRHGCPVKQDVQLSPVASQSENANRNLSGPHEHFRFSFKPTIVSDPSDPRKALPMRLLYIHCRVRLCAQDSCPSPADCAKPASSGGNNVARRKRAIREEGYGAGLYAGHNLATGPFVLTQDDKDAPRSPALISPLVVALAALAGTTTLIALGVIVAWTFSRRRGWRSERYEVNGVIAASRQ